MICYTNFLHSPLLLVITIGFWLYLITCRIFPKTEPNKLKIHLLYISSILLFIIVELCSYIAIDSDPHGQLLMPYISFASTLASIILSVLAIILTIVSTSKGDSFIVKIEQTFSKLEGTLEQLNQLPTKTTKNIEDATKRMSELLASAENFTKKIELLHSKTEELNKNVCKSGEKLNQAIGTQLKDNKEPSYPNGDKFYKLLVTSGSFYGVLAYFICFLAYKYNKDHKQICINKITSKIPEWEEYMVGYLVASSATGMLKIKLIERDAYGITFRVDNFTDKIKEEDIRKSIEIFISSQENTDKEDTKKLIDQIDDYFNPTTI